MLSLENAKLKKENAKLKKEIHQLKKQLPNPPVDDPKALGTMFTELSDTEFGKLLTKFKDEFDKNNKEVAQILGLPPGSIDSIKQWIDGHKCQKEEEWKAKLQEWVDAEAGGGGAAVVTAAVAVEDQGGGAPQVEQ